MDEVCRSCAVLLVSIPDLGFAFLESCLFECMLSITCDRNQTVPLWETLRDLVVHQDYNKSSVREDSVHQVYSVIHQDITREPNDLYYLVIYLTAYTCEIVRHGIWHTVWYLLCLTETFTYELFITRQGHLRANVHENRTKSFFSSRLENSTFSSFETVYM